MSGSTRRLVEVTNELGLHLRAASRFVQVCRRFQSAIRVSCGGQVADGSSVLDLMSLAAECGARLELEADGPDAREAVAALVSFVEGRFDEGANNSKLLDQRPST